VENLREPAGFSTFCSVGEQNVENPQGGARIFHALSSRRASKI
jgi:hypothetical protein